MPSHSFETSQNLESAAPKKRNTEANAPRRRKTLSGGSNPKKAPPQADVSKATQAAAAKTPVKAEEPAIALLARMAVIEAGEWNGQSFRAAFYFG